MGRIDAMKSVNRHLEQTRRELEARLETPSWNWDGCEGTSASGKYQNHFLATYNHLERK